MMKITIFTPTYNRVDTIRRLYDSLCRQSSKEFEWLIVDDGSKDDTKKMVNQWIVENKIIINYYYQKNSGKMVAHNRGVKLAQGELFVCVDSDDILSDNAIERTIMEWEKHKKNCIGILAYKVQLNGKPSTILKNTSFEYSTLKNAYDYYGLSGDTMLIFRTDILSKYQFPVFSGEKFVPEGYLYDLLDQEGKLYFLREKLYICEYQENGYTSNMAKLLKNNPQGYFVYINQRLKLDKTGKQKFLDSIRYDAMAIAQKKKHIIATAVYPFWSFVAYLPGVLFYYKRYKNI